MVATERLLELVAQIKDPAGPKCRELLVPATHSVVYEVTRTGSSSLPRVEHRLTGTLTVGSGQAAVHIALDHRWETGARAAMTSRVQAYLDEMRSGVAFGDMTTPMARHSRGAIAEALGVPQGELLLPRILDGRITRAVLHTIYQPDGRSLPEIAADLDEPTGFIERIAQLYAEPPPRWLRGNARYLTALYASAARNQGLAQLSDIREWAGTKRARLTTVVNEADDGLVLVRGVGYRVPACGSCGSHRLAPLQIREPIGPVCLECRTDRGGLAWPADPYDKYIAEPGVWALASIG